MNEIKERIIEEQKSIIGIVPVMNMKNFVMLLLADLASKSKIYHLDGRKTKTACLSADYKRIIEDIMYQENGWGIKFAELINIYTYYEFQQEWEEKLGRTLKEVLDKLHKEVTYDYERDIIEIEFTEEEIDNIKSTYDEKTLEVMDHFSNLIVGYVFNRKFKLDKKDLNRTKNRLQYSNENISKICELTRRYNLYLEENFNKLNKNRVIKKDFKSRN